MADDEGTMSLVKEGYTTDHLLLDKGPIEVRNNETLDSTLKTISQIVHIVICSSHEMTLLFPENSASAPNLLQKSLHLGCHKLWIVFLNEMATVRGEYNTSSSIRVAKGQQLFVIFVPCSENMLVLVPD